jgi:hypothetical protein
VETDDVRACCVQCTKPTVRRQLMEYRAKAACQIIRTRAHGQERGPLGKFAEWPLSVLLLTGPSWRTVLELIRYNGHCTTDDLD